MHDRITLGVASSVFITLLFLNISCNQERAPSEPVAPTPAARNGEQRPHWVQSKELQGVMQQVAALRGSVPAEELPKDVESPQTRESNVAFESAAALGEALANTAMKIPAAAKSRQMSEADRNAFVAIAQTLHKQAIDVRDAARARKVEKMQSVLDQMNTTCLSCHTRFRDFAGQLDFPKADVSPR